MSLFDSASIVVTPNAYKASKLYAIKPTDGSGDLTVVRATTARRVNSAGLIESVANNVPRLDYTNGSCPSILVEPQRTNLVAYSEEFDQSYWLKQNIIVTANSTTSPDGNLTADTFIANNVNTQHRFDRSISGTGGVTYTFSAFFKAKEYDKIMLRTADQGSSTFDLTNGIVLSSTLGVTAKIESYNNNWYRCSVSQILTTTSTMTSRINILNENGLLNFAGDGTSGLYIWGAQLEAGSNATSYIPTTTASVTRNADVISKTGISSLIGQTEGTIFVDIFFKESVKTDNQIITISDGTIANRFVLRIFNNTIFECRIVKGNVVQTLITSGSIVTDTIKLAIAYNLNDIVFYINGNLIGTDNNSLIPNTNKINLGSNSTGVGILDDRINSAILFKTRLTNDELATLTTL